MLVTALLLASLTATNIAMAPSAQANGNCVTYWGPRGAGTALNPFPIATQLDLDELRFCLSNNFTFSIENDLALTGTWTPIGDLAHPFIGTLRGNGHTISGLSTLDGSAVRVGLFGSTQATLLNDVHVEGSISGSTYVGGLVGYADSTSIEDSSVDISINMGDASHTSASYIGGLVGKSAGGTTIVDSSADVHIAPDPSISPAIGDYVGGIVGQHDSGALTGLDVSGVIQGRNSVGGIAGEAGWGGAANISNAATATTVSGNASVGGVVGKLYNGNIFNTSATGNVTGSSLYVGGIAGDVGWAASGTVVSNVSSIGTVTGDSYTGGLIGILYQGELLDSSSSGTVTSSLYYAGGLVGSIVGSTTATVSECSSSATVTGTYYVGGLLGYGSANISDVISTGDITANYYSGGIVGSYTRGNLTRAKSAGQISGSAYVGGLVGSSMPTTASFTDSYSRGTVTADAQSAGSLFGYVSSSGATVSRVYGTGLVTGTGSDIGGFVGSTNQTSYSQSFWDTETTGRSSATGIGSLTGATGATTATLTAIAPFLAAGWSIGDWAASGTTWGICPQVNNGYPYLQFEYDTDPCVVISPGSGSSSAPITTVTLNFDTQGGSCSVASLTAPQGEVRRVLNLTHCSRDGFTLLGWSTGRDGIGRIFSPDEETVLTSDNTLYAQWQKVDEPESTIAERVPPAPRISAHAWRSSRYPSYVIVRGRVNSAQPEALPTVWWRDSTMKRYRRAELLPSTDSALRWRIKNTRALLVFVVSADKTFRTKNLRVARLPASGQ
jgi:hypothetical protein